MRKVEFISLGPWCHTAGILRSCDLRNCSYPFDWCQSGFIQHSEVLKLNPREFYYRHMHNPTMHFEYHELTEPDTIGHTLGKLERVMPRYGFEFFYNPHRKHGQEIAYFLRCLRRLREVCSDSSVSKVFVLADYIDKPGNTFLSHSHEVAHLVEDNILNNALGKAYCLIFRTKIVDNNIGNYTYHRITDKVLEIRENLPSSIEYSMLDDETGLFEKFVIASRKKAINIALSLLNAHFNRSSSKFLRANAAVIGADS